MKTKYLKFLSVFVAVIIAFSCFLFVPASAVTQPYCGFSWSQPPAGDDCGYVEFLCKKDGLPCAIVYSFKQVNNYTLESVNDIYGYVDATRSSAKVTFTNNGYYPFVFGGFFYRWEAGYINYETLSVASSDEGDIVYEIWLPDGFTIYKVRCYGFLKQGFDSSTVDSLFNGNNSFGPITYGNDTIVNDKLDTIISILRSFNNDDIVQSIEVGTSSIVQNDKNNTDTITANQNSNTDKITANQNSNTDKMLNAGSDVNQPDFAGTNNQLDNTTAQMNALEGQYKIDPTSTTAELNKGTVFISGSNMQKASVQVKTWIERFSSENPVISSFLVAALCLGLCFWVIGRKAASG